MHISEEFRSERWAIIIIAVAVVTITVAVRAFVFLRYTTDRRRDKPCFPTLWLLSSVLRKIRILEAELVRVNLSKSQYFCLLKLESQNCPLRSNSGCAILPKFHLNQGESRREGCLDQLCLRFHQHRTTQS